MRPSDLVTPHITSPDVHVDDKRGEIVMYFHGLESLGPQSSRRAVSSGGVADFTIGPTLFEPAMRHSAVRVVGDTLEVWWTRAGDCPERILRSTTDLRQDWMEWSESEPVEIMRPERD